MLIEYTKRIICFANSRKISGRCVAGKEIDGQGIGGWIRPVSGRVAGEVSFEERRYRNGQDPALLDIIEIPMRSALPHKHQLENHLLDEDWYWTWIRKATTAEVRAALDYVPGVLWDNSSTSYSGLHDRVDESRDFKQEGSLKLISVSDLTISVALEGAAFGNGKRKVRGRFTLNGHNYGLGVTDPVVEQRFLAGDDGEFQVGRAILCVSLGDAYKGYLYKLIAGVLLPPEI